MSELLGHPEYDPDFEVKKLQWLSELADFLVEANTNTWPADSGEVEPTRMGYKEYRYPLIDLGEDWLSLNGYSGYFRAPGTTTVYYKSRPAWMLTYAGNGLNEAYFHTAKETFAFLKEALMSVSVELPIRGPLEYSANGKHYVFRLLEGDLSDGLWEEEITENGKSLFSQIGTVSLVVPKDEEGLPVYPWDDHWTEQSFAGESTMGVRRLKTEMTDPE